jgi:mannose-6-phosphate isomerase-like protein (cupin superfamily)
MNRRLFFRFPVIAATFASARSSIAATLAQVALPRRERILVRAGVDRDDKPFKFLDASFHVKVSGKDNEDRCVIFDTLRPEKVGPPLHLHTDCDEWFFVRDGKFKFKTDDEVISLETGNSLFVPRNVPHAFVKTSEGSARLIVMHQPAGTMEEYFCTASQRTNHSPEQRRALAEKHGMQILGPPPTAD